MAGPYMKDLGFLIRGIDAGALRGEDALSTLMSIDQEQEERRAARKAAQAEAMAAQQGVLDTLLSSATAAASEGTGLEALMSQLAPQIQSAPQVAPQLAASLESLYYPQGGINAGVSRLEPTLRPEDADDIHAIISNNGTPDDVHRTMANLYGPKVYSRIAPQIDEILGDVMKQQQTLNVYGG